MADCSVSAVASLVKTAYESDDDFILTVVRNHLVRELSSSETYRAGNSMQVMIDSERLVDDPVLAPYAVGFRNDRRKLQKAGGYYKWGEMMRERGEEPDFWVDWVSHGPGGTGAFKRPCGRPRLDLLAVTACPKTCKAAEEGDPPEVPEWWPERLEAMKARVQAAREAAQKAGPDERDSAGLSVFRLKDGRTIRGRVVMKADSLLFIQTAEGKTLKVKKEEMLAEETPPAVKTAEGDVIRLKDGKVIRGKVVVRLSTALLVKLEDGTLKRIRLSELSEGDQ
jgi:hypothetical protein